MIKNKSNLSNNIFTVYVLIAKVIEKVLYIRFFDTSNR